MTREKPIELIEEFNLVEVPKNQIKNILRDKILSPHRKPHKKYNILHYKGDNYISISLNFWDRFALPLIYYQ